MNREQVTDDDLRFLAAVKAAVPKGWHPTDLRNPREGDNYLVFTGGVVALATSDFATYGLILAPDAPAPQNCPVCGSVPRIHQACGRKWVSCDETTCGINGPAQAGCNAEPMAIAAWNRLRFAPETKAEEEWGQ